MNKTLTLLRIFGLLPFFNASKCSSNFCASRWKKKEKRGKKRNKKEKRGKRRKKQTLRKTFIYLYRIPLSYTFINYVKLYSVSGSTLIPPGMITKWVSEWNNEWVSEMGEWGKWVSEGRAKKQKTNKSDENQLMMMLRPGFLPSGINGTQKVSRKASINDYKPCGTPISDLRDCVEHLYKTKKPCGTSL